MRARLQHPRALVGRWHKLQAEDAFNSASLAERRDQDRAFGKLVRSAVKAKPDQGREPGLIAPALALRALHLGGNALCGFKRTLKIAAE